MRPNVLPTHYCKPYLNRGMRQRVKVTNVREMEFGTTDTVDFCRRHY
jgi:hypothetical protein